MGTTGQATWFIWGTNTLTKAPDLQVGLMGEFRASTFCKGYHNVFEEPKTTIEGLMRCTRFGFSFGLEGADEHCSDRLTWSPSSP